MLWLAKEKELALTRFIAVVVTRKDDSISTALKCPLFILCY